VATNKTLTEAVKDIVKTTGQVRKWDAKALKELILADGRISTEERLFLEKAIEENRMDEQAQNILKDLLLRDELGSR
jgi:hypothetical protein